MSRQTGSTRWHLSRPNRGLLRVAFRLPVYLYRLHLGWLLGHRFLLLRHTGRHSGRPHQTVLEVIGYDPVWKESIVVSAWGDRADWYRNIRVQPALEIVTGRDRYIPEQRILSQDEAYAVISAYVRRHRRAASQLSRLLPVPLGESETSQREFAARVPMVAFRPRQSARPGS